MPITTSFTDGSILYAANLNNSFAMAPSIIGDNFTGPVSIQGLDIKSGLINAYNAVNAAFSQANSSSGSAAAFNQANTALNAASAAFLEANSFQSIIGSAYGRANTLDGIGSIIVTATGGVAVGGGSTTTLTSNGTIAITANSATTSISGVVQLNDTISSVSTTQAATANALSTVFNIATAAYSQANTGGGGTSNVTISTTSQTANYTLALVDAGTLIEMNSSNSLIVTIPTSANVAFLNNTIIEICQLGSGTITIGNQISVIVFSPATNTTRTQYSTIGLRKRLTNSWILSGDLT